MIRRQAFAQALRVEWQIRNRGPSVWLAPGRARLIDDETRLKEQAALHTQVKSMTR